MPRAKKGGIPVAEKEIPSDLAALQEQIGPAELPPDVDSILDELGGSVTRVVLFRKPEKGAQYDFVGELTADEFSLAEIQEKFGGGKYLIRFAGVGEDGNGVRWLKAKTVSIASPSPAALRVRERGGDDPTAALLREVLTELRASRTPALDPAAMFAAIGNMGTAVSSQVNALLPLLAGKGGGDGVSVDKALDMFTKGMEFAQDSGGDGGGYLGVVRELGKPLLEMITAERTRQKLLGGSQPKPEGQRMVNQPAQPEQPQQPGWVRVLKGYVPQLIQLALRNEDVQVLAMALESQAPKMNEWLADRVEEAGVDGMTRMMIEHFPALAPHQQWLTSLLAEFAPADEGDDLTEGEEQGEEEQGEEPQTQGLG